MKRIILITSLLLPFALPLVVTSASRPAPAVADACCAIVSIDRENGIVTARDLRTGETFKFEVDSRALLKSLRVGQKVWKQAGGSKVGITEATLCCAIVGKGNASPGVTDEAHKDEIEVLSIVGKGNASPGRSTASSTANASSGATIDGKTLILKKGYEASIDPKNRGVVRVRDLGGRGATAEYTCGCDPDEGNAEGNPETCRFYNDGDRLKCMSPTCKDCDVSETTKVGTDKPQDEASPGVSTSPATATGGRTDPARTLVSLPIRWEIKPNPKLKGASGQIVFQFPELNSHGIYEIGVFEIEGTKQITPTWYGSRSFALLEGEYDVEINGMRVSRVPVKGGSDTRLHTGIVRFNTPGGTWVEVFDVNQKKPLCSWNGPSSCVVPPGEFHVKIGGSSKKVTIADGQVIDF